jgi:hypothetical protein
VTATTAFVEAMGGMVPAGVRLKVGQGETLDIGHSTGTVLQSDPALHSRHFRVRMAPDGLLVEQIGQAMSWVNGTPLGRTLCKTGDWIQAGTTMFRVMLYSPYSSDALESPIEALICSLVGEVDGLHVMFDLADCGGIDGFLPQWRDHAIELAKSPEGGVVYLCSLRAMPEGVRPFVQSGLGERYGIWIKENGPGLAKHLLRYLNGRKWFPFYQPYVLSAFWEGGLEKMRRRFLGPMNWIGVRKTDPSILIKLDTP